MADGPPSLPSAPRRVDPVGIVGWVLLGVTLLSFLASIPAPNHRARKQALEMAAIEQILTIQAAQAQYYSQFGRFATELEELGAWSLYISTQECFGSRQPASGVVTSRLRRSV